MSQNTPEGVIKKYISEVTKSEKDIEQLRELLTGELDEQLEGLSSEEVTEFFEIGAIKSTKVNITKTSCDQEDICFVTYNLSYETIDEAQKPDFETQVRKVAKVVKVDGSWKIAEISNVKTYHEAQNAIEVDSKN